MYDIAETRPEFQTLKNETLHFVRLEGSEILAWTHPVAFVSSTEMSLKWRHVTQVSQETLERLEVWDKLSSKLQSLIKGIKADTDACIRREPIRIVPSPPEECEKPVVLKTEKTVKSGYKKGCRGRQPDPRYIGLPRKIPCSSCGKPAGMGPGLLLSTADAAGLSWEEWIKTYLCRKCKGASSSTSSSTSRRGRPPNPAYDGIPKKLLCSKCKGLKGTTPEQYLKQVEKSGKSRKMFERHYKCRSCRK